MVIFKRKFLDFSLRAGTNPGNTPNPYFPYAIPYFLFFLFPPYSAKFGTYQSQLFLKPPHYENWSQLLKIWGCHVLALPHLRLCLICGSSSSAAPSSLFFAPTPLWLPPGRYTSCYLLEIN